MHSDKPLTTPSLFDRWSELLETLKSKCDPVTSFQRLATHYSEDHRQHHTLAHIETCFLDYDDMAETPEDPAKLELAIFFHDVIYDPRSDENEVNSYFAMERFCKQTCLIPFHADMFDMFRATKHTHGSRYYLEHDAKLLVDIDLSILGKSRDIYLDYELKIREEYRRVPLDVYIAGRTQVLQRFLKFGDNLYLTPYFREKYGAQAKINLTRALESLREHIPTTEKAAL